MLRRHDKGPDDKSTSDKSPRQQKFQTTKAPGIAIFLFTLYSFRIRLEFFPLRCCRLVARFARDVILTSSSVVLVRYWLVFLNQVKNFPTTFLRFSKTKTMPGAFVVWSFFHLWFLSSGTFVVWSFCSLGLL